MKAAFRQAVCGGTVFPAAAQRALFHDWAAGPMTKATLAALIHAAALPGPVPVRRAMASADRMIQRWRETALVERRIHGRNQGWVPRRV